MGEAGSLNLQECPILAESPLFYDDFMVDGKTPLGVA
jgi:hypothetical protein